MMVGPLIDKRMRSLGYNQTSLSRATDGELRQNYISQVIRGEIAVPLGRKAELFREHLKISKDDWYTAAGMLEGEDSDQSSTEDIFDRAPLTLLVQFLNEVPDIPRFDQLGQLDSLTPASRERMTRRIARNVLSQMRIELEEEMLRTAEEVQARSQSRT